MKREDLNELDIVLFNSKIVQVIELFETLLYIQDIHSRIEPMVYSLIERKATKDEVKWFCENSETIDFKPPNTPLR